MDNKKKEIKKKNKEKQQQIRLFCKTMFYHKTEITKFPKNPKKKR